MRKAFLLVLFLSASSVFAACNFINVNLIQTAAGTQAQDATFTYPITLTNAGLYHQLAQLSGACPDGLSCRFEPQASDTLVPSQTKTFTLVVQTSNSGNFSIPIHVAETTSPCYNNALTLQITPNSTAIPQGELTASINPVLNESARPGDSVEYVVSITNNGPEKVYASIENNGAFKDTTRFSFVDFNLDPLETKTLKATITVPPGTPFNKYFPVFVVKSITNSGCCEKTFTFPSQLFVYADKLLLTLQNEPTQCVKVNQTERRELNLTIRNDGDVEGPFTLKIEANEQTKQIVSLEKTLVEVASRDKQPLHIAITPSMTSVLGTYQFNLVGRYLDFTVFQRPYCFAVNAKTDFEVSLEEEYEVTRGKLNELPFTVENTGTASLNFSVEPTPQNGFQLSSNPQYFSLPAKQATTVKLLAGTALVSTPLGKTNLTVILRTSNVSKSFTVPLNVVSSVEPGNSFISVSQTPLTAVAGVETTQFVDVVNKKSTGILHNVTIELQGVPKEWVTVKTPLLDVLPGKTAPIEFVLKPPAGEQGQRKVVLHASSAEGEKTSRETTLNILEPRKRMDIALTNLQYQDKYVTATVRVLNTGLVALTGITPSITGFTVSTDSGVFNLEPGESRNVVLTIARQDKDIPLQLTSNEGISSGTLVVTARPPAREEISTSWLLTAVIIMVLIMVALAFYVRKEQIEANTTEAY